MQVYTILIFVGSFSLFNGVHCPVWSVSVSVLYACSHAHCAAPMSEKSDCPPVCRWWRARHSCSAYWGRACSRRPPLRLRRTLFIGLVRSHISWILSLQESLSHTRHPSLLFFFFVPSICTFCFNSCSWSIISNCLSVLLPPYILHCCCHLTLFSSIFVLSICSSCEY